MNQWSIETPAVVNVNVAVQQITLSSKFYLIFIIPALCSLFNGVLSFSLFVLTAFAGDY